MYCLDTNERRVRFSVLVSTSSAELVGANQIVGKRIGSKVWANRARSLTEEFLNCGDDPQSILHFTKRYGPVNDLSGRDQFQFDIGEWRKDQARLRRWWEVFADYGRRSRQRASVVVEAVPRDLFRLDHKGLTYECANLSHYMVLEIASLPAQRLRRCYRQGCKHVFVARDLREKYCSDSCKTEERNRSKLRYWNEHKQSFLAERIKERKAERDKKHVTRKTR